MIRSSVDVGGVSSFNVVADADISTRGTFKLVMAFVLEANVTISSVTVGGSPASRLGQIVNTTASPDLVLEVWTIDVTAGSPSGTIAVTLSGNITSSVFLVRHQLYNVRSVGAAQTVSGDATGAAVNVDTLSGSYLVAYHIRAAQGQTVTWTGVDETTDFDLTISALPFARFSCGERAACDAETGRTVQAVGSASGQYATLAMAFHP